MSDRRSLADTIRRRITAAVQEGEANAPACRMSELVLGFRADGRADALREILADVEALEAERDRLDRVLRCERGESAPEGWEVRVQEVGGERFPDIRIQFLRGPPTSRGRPRVSRVRDGWEWQTAPRGAPDCCLGVEPTALHAIEAANAALAETP